MNPEDYTVRKHPSPAPGRRMQLALIGLAALLIGSVGGFAYLRLPGLDRQPDQAAVETPTPRATEAATAITATEVAESTSSETPSTLPTQTSPAEVAMRGTVPVISSTNRAAGSALNSAIQAIAPTATSTPIPPVESTEGVIGVGGADIWDAESGRLLGHAEQGDAVTVRERSADGEWLHVETAEIDGWVRTDDVIVFDPSRLAAREVVIMPVTPTPTPTLGTPAATATGSPSIPTGGTPAARPTPSGDGPVARVTLEDARLNIRSGPGASYPIIAKALPGESFAVLGRSANGDWLQLAVPDVEGGFGWAALEFLSSSVPVGDLPVVSGTSPAPSYQGEAGPEETGYAGPHGTSQEKGLPQKKGYRAAKTGAPARPASVTGLYGKLLLQQSWGGSIYVYDLVTGSLRLLTGGFDPSISPDGQTVAFTRAGGEHGLYLINIDGSDERLIFSGRELLRSPKWSPDGQWIVFERGDEYEVCRNTGSRCTDPDSTSDEIPITFERQEKLARVDRNGQNYRDMAVLQRARVPDWNEAGIVYQSPAGIQITMDSPQFTTSQLVYFNIRKQYEMDPDWQPGGGRIVFHRREASHWEIFSVNPDGSGLTALTMPSFTLVPELPSNVAPAWSPDGQHIVFLSNRTPEQSAGPWHVWVMDADGSNQRMLPVELDFTYTFVSEQMIDWGR